MTSSPQNRTLWLVRHGDTIWSHTGGIAGRSDIELSEQGRARVVQLAATATTPVSQASWFVSPLKRTRETMNLLRSGSMHPASPSDANIFHDDRLVELDFGDWEGLSWEAVHQQQSDVLANWGQNWVTSAPPGGETFQEHYERCSAWLDDWISTQDHHGSTSDYATSAVAANTAKTARPVSRSATAASGDAVVVTHGGSIRALLCNLLDLPLEQAMRWSVDLACVYRLTWYSQQGRWLLRAANHRSF